MNFELKKIDLFSAIKISVCINIVIGIIFALLFGSFMAVMFAIMDQLEPGGSSTPPEFAMFGGLIFVVIYAIALIVINGIIIPLITVLLYNFFAGWLGGMKFRLDEIPSEIQAQPIMTQAKATTPPPDTTGGNI
jgi:fatty acid desaturase